ncbi:transglutaminase family protein [bacterium]|nr:MAG: transglutaminase family protein [bacterium]
MLLRVRHRTEYRYAGNVLESHNELRLEPQSDDRQKLLDFKVTVEPDARVWSHTRAGGNVHHFTLREPHDRMAVTAESLVRTSLVNPYEGLNLLVPDWDVYLGDAMRWEQAEFLSASRFIDPVPARELAEAAKEGQATVGTFLGELNQRIHSWLSYDPDATHVHSTVSEVLQGRAGVCQDFAHVAIACCRAVGVPARYVSGYLYTGDDGSMRGEAATHAWAEALLPDGRWIGFDPTNNLFANDRYVRTHIGRDYDDCAPTRGVFLGPKTQALRVSVSVHQVSEDEVPVPVVRAPWPPSSMTHHQQQ